ncbi:hypothetical protein CKAH01_18357 [Colletotrichum kahawae]|uniref:Uncharacterized protein n=1 Tax=Colletotrichum kahawae TaxID=34407 RepID=A0AAE0D309_COLKA|nr:hypothetical protein CKAH01_18357 [Colletotrichum kahawae]
MRASVAVVAALLSFVSSVSGQGEFQTVFCQTIDGKHAASNNFCQAVGGAVLPSPGKSPYYYHDLKTLVIRSIL